MKKVCFLVSTALLLFTISCKKDTHELASGPEQYDAEHYINLAEDILADGAEEVEFRGATVTVSPGSSLQAAVDAAGQGGTVILENGTHAESGTVTITQRLKITGQPGAIVEFDSDDTPGFPFVTNPGFHILGANQVVIENLHIRDADNAGATAILIEGSNQTRIRNNSILNFEIGIAQYGGNGTRVHGNTVTGKVSFGGVGVLNVVGDNMKIYDNSITDNNIDVFVGDKGGLIKDNYFSGNGNIGLLLCTPNIGGAYLVLPSGQSAVADESANRWLVLNNYSENHLWNYLVIDNANNNTLVNNNAANAVLLDIEMAGDSDRFGFFTPTSFDNLVISSTLPDITVKVCGVNNRAVGGDQVDTSLFPCE